MPLVDVAGLFQALDDRARARGRDRAGRNHLSAREWGVGSARLRGMGGFSRVQPPPLGLFARDYLACFHDQPLGILEAPKRRHTMGLGLARDDVLHNLP